MYGCTKAHVYTCIPTHHKEKRLEMATLGHGHQQYCVFYDRIHTPIHMFVVPCAVGGVCTR